MLLTVLQVAELLQVNVTRVYEVCRLGLLPHVRIGRQVRISEDELKDWIQNGGTSLPGGWRKEAR